MSSSFWPDRPTFVTGATGLVGAWTLRRLVDAGADVVCLVRDWVPGSEAVRSGLLESRDGRAGRRPGPAPSLERTLGEYEIDTVLHLAAQTIVGDREPQPGLDVRDERRRHLGAARGLPAEPARAVRSCSRRPTRRTASRQRLPYREDTPLEGRHPYDVSKSCADLIATSYAVTYELPVAITRCGNFFGGGDLNWNRIVPGTIRSVLRGPAAGDPLGRPLRARLLLRRGRRRGVHAARGVARRQPGRAPARRSTSRTRRSSRSPSSSGASSRCSAATSRRRSAARRATRSRRSSSMPRRRAARSAGSRSSPSTRASSGRSRGTARRSERRRDSAALPVVRRARGRDGLSLGETPLANSLVAPERLDEPEPTYPLDLAFCRGLLARADHRDRAARRAVPRLRLLLVLLRHDAPPRRRARRRARRQNAVSARRASSWRRRRTTATCSGSTGAAGVPRARHRAGAERRRRGRGARHPDRSPSSSTPRSPSALAGGGDARRRLPRPQRARARRRSQRLRRVPSRRCSRTTGSP